MSHFKRNSETQRGDKRINDRGALSLAPCLNQLRWNMRTRYDLYKGLLPFLVLASLLSACSPAIVWDYPRTPSNTFAHPGTTTVGALFQEAADKHPGLSGFSLIRQGGPAFMARLAMADLAEKTLDGTTSGMATPAAWSWPTDCYVLRTAVSACACWSTTII